MHERTELCLRMLSEAERRINEFSNILEEISRYRTSELRRPLNLMATSQRNMDWITETASWFEFPPECIRKAEELKPALKYIINNINGRIADNKVKLLSDKKNTNHNKNFTISLDGNGILNAAEIDRIDSFIRVLEDSPPVDHMALHESTREQRLSEIDTMFSDGLSFGETTNAPPILNQPEEEFCAALKVIDNNIIEQIKIIEHCLPRWFSMGEFPPPYYAWRIAVILGKAKEYGRERKFLHAYLLNFRSRFGGSRTDERLVERAEKMGIELPRRP